MSEKIAIVGSGLIGQNWSMIFAAQGYKVHVFDVDPGQLTRAEQNISRTLTQYEEEGFLRGDSPAAEQTKLVTFTSSLQECLTEAIYVQECVPENLDLKRKVFAQIDQIVSGETVVASSSSCLPASSFTEGLKNRERMLVAHPINPPYFVPLVELVPAPWTKQEALTMARELMEKVGQSPVTLRRESLGFALNRIQYAAINECWNMYQSGLLSAEDIDKVCYDGLGPRYAFIGPLQTMHLNADGIVDYCKRYADGAYNVQKETFKPIPVQYDVETAEKIQAEYNASIPLDKIPDKRKWRDTRLANLAKMKKQLEDK
ncbi:lambda-crystallin-like [Saccostrea cucullata]|uniref:lambda-crystallin-like n=1 Tax=Saccostrea cuccullata TaxID=36930 RepID=UPI002ED208F0